MRVTKSIRELMDEIINEGTDVFLARWENADEDTAAELEAKYDLMCDIAQEMRRRLKIPDFDPSLTYGVVE